RIFGIFFTIFYQAIGHQPSYYQYDNNKNRCKSLRHNYLETSSIRRQPTRYRNLQGLICKNFIIKKAPAVTCRGSIYNLAPTYSPTCYGSTIGSGGLDCSVRNGKR